MSLPDDILDYILSFLISDLPTLKKCAKTHPTLFKFAERYIYANITLDWDDGQYDHLDPSSRRTSDFAQILVKKPEIATYVRCVKVYLDPDLLDLQPMSPHFKSIADMLPMFSGLTTIKLAGKAANSIPLSWRVLPKIFCQAISEVLHVQSMKNVYISNVAFFPLVLLNNCQNIRVTLDGCTDIEYDKDSAKDLSHPKFEHLFVQFCCDMSMEKITVWMKTHRLRSLAYNMSVGRVNEFNNFVPRFLLACSNSLTNLDLDIKDKFHTLLKISKNSGIENQDYEPFPFTLADLSCLERLTISSYLIFRLLGNKRGWRHDSPVPGITALISTAPPSLKRLYLCFTFFGQQPDPDVLWNPFVPLVAKGSSISITVHVSVVRAFGGILRPDTVPLPVGSTELRSYVKTGVLIVA